LQIAMSARRVAERHGIALADVHPCEAIGPDGTQLVSCASCISLSETPRLQNDQWRSSYSLPGRRTGRLRGCSWPSVIAIQDRAYAASTSEHTANCMVDSPSTAALCRGRARRGANGGANLPRSSCKCERSDTAPRMDRQTSPLLHATSYARVKSSLRI
jgi:hypothetical protein